MLSEVLEAAQDPHPLPTHSSLDLKPTGTSGISCEMHGPLRDLQWPHGALLQGCSWEATPGAAHPLPMRAPKGEALQQGKEHQARQKQGKTMAEQLGAAQN